MPYTSLASISIYNKINKTPNTQVSVYMFDFLYTTFEILGKKQYINNPIIVSGFDSNNSYKTMQYLSFKAINKCDRAILFVNNNDCINSDIYDDIKQIQSRDYKKVEIILESGEIINITNKQNYLAYKYKQYSKEIAECKQILKKYQR